MADDAEKSVDAYELHLQGSLETHRVMQARAKPNIESSGDCDLCGNPFTRLVQREYRGEKVDACGRCRDRYKLG